MPKHYFSLFFVACFAISCAPDTTKFFPESIGAVPKVSPKHKPIAATVTDKGAGVEVQWLIADTVGVDNYEVQRSVEGELWSSIYRLPLRRAQFGIEESFLDPQPVNGQNYYRVIKRGYNNEVLATSLPQLAMHYGLYGLTLYPNPVALGQPVYLRFEGPVNNEFQLELVNDRGRRLQYQAISATGQLEQLNFIPQAGSAGSYIVNLYLNDRPVGTWPLQVR